jgi:hypothetical protein
MDINRPKITIMASSCSKSLSKLQIFMRELFNIKVDGSYVVFSLDDNVGYIYNIKLPSGD